MLRSTGVICSLGMMFLILLVCGGCGGSEDALTEQAESREDPPDSNG